MLPCRLQHTGEPSEGPAGQGRGPAEGGQDWWWVLVALRVK